MVEIGQYLRKAGRWVVLLLVVPLAGAGLAVVWFDETSQAQYQALATVLVDPPSGGGTPVSVSQATETFVASVQSQPVLAAVSEETGVPVGEIAESTESVPVGASGLVEMTYVGPREDEAQDILRLLAIEAQSLLFSTTLGANEIALTSAEEEFTDSVGTAADSGVAQLEARVDTAESRVQRLQSQLVVAPTQAERDEISRLLEAAQDQLERLQGRLAELAPVTSGLSVSESLLAEAERDLATTEARLSSATSDAGIKLTETTEYDPTTEMVRAGISGAIVGFLLAAAAVGLVIVLRGRKDSEAAQETAGTPADTLTTGRPSRELEEQVASLSGS